MTLDEYIIQLKGTCDKLIAQEEFELCGEVRDLIESIEKKDLQRFIEIMIPVKELTEIGFLDKGDTVKQIAEKVRVYYGLDCIYDYAIRRGLWCGFERYANGIYDIIKKINF